MVYLVKDFMTKVIDTVDAEISVAEASKKIADNPRGYLIVLMKGQPSGMVTEKDLIGKVMAKDLDPKDIKVLEIMSSPLLTIEPDEELIRATEKMKANNVRKLPVVKNGIIYGIITMRDIAYHFNEYVSKAISDALAWSNFSFFQ